MTYMTHIKKFRSSIGIILSGLILTFVSEIVSADGFSSPFKGLLGSNPLDFLERSQPSISSVGHAKIYADMNSHSLKASFNGGSYTTFGATGATGAGIDGGLSGAPGGRDGGVGILHNPNPQQIMLWTDAGTAWGTQDIAGFAVADYAGLTLGVGATTDADAGSGLIVYGGRNIPMGVYSVNGIRYAGMTIDVSSDPANNRILFYSVNTPNFQVAFENGLLSAAHITTGSLLITGSASLASTTVADLTIGTNTFSQLIIINSVQTVSADGGMSKTLLTVPIPDNSSTWIEANMTGRTITGLPDGGPYTRDRSMYILRALVYRESAGSAAIQGTVDVFEKEGTSATGWDATITVSGNNALVTVTGEVPRIVKWAGTASYQSAQ